MHSMVLINGFVRFWDTLLAPQAKILVFLGEKKNPRFPLKNQCRNTKNFACGAAPKKYQKPDLVTSKPPSLLDFGFSTYLGGGSPARHKQMCERPYCQV